MDNDNVTIEIVNGVGGNAVYINDYRVAGVEPYGGGTVEKIWTIDKKRVLEALDIKG